MSKTKEKGMCKACLQAELDIDLLDTEVVKLRIALAKVALRGPFDGKGPCEIAQDALGWLATSELWDLVGDSTEEDTP